MSAAGLVQIIETFNVVELDNGFVVGFLQGRWQFVVVVGDELQLYQASQPDQRGDDLELRSIYEVRIV